MMEYTPSFWKGRNRQTIWSDGGEYRATRTAAITEFRRCAQPIVSVRVCLDNCDYSGHIGGQPIQDVIFKGSCLPCPGPFPDVSSFHNYFVKAWTPNSEDLELHEYRSLLPDSSSIKFMHGELHPTNILVSPEGTPPRIVTIIDWHQSGWLPEYWEFCKVVYSVYYDEWETYVRWALKEPEGYMGFEWFSLSLI